MKNLTSEINTVLEMGLTAILHSKNHTIAITKINDRLFLNDLMVGRQMQIDRI